jgi:hypothetical protein
MLNIKISISDTKMLGLTLAHSSAFVSSLLHDHCPFFLCRLLFATAFDQTDKDHKDNEASDGETDHFPSRQRRRVGSGLFERVFDCVAHVTQFVHERSLLGIIEGPIAGGTGVSGVGTGIITRCHVHLTLVDANDVP